MLALLACAAPQVSVGVTFLDPAGDPAEGQLFVHGEDGELLRETTVSGGPVLLDDVPAGGFVTAAWEYRDGEWMAESRGGVEAGDDFVFRLGLPASEGADTAEDLSPPAGVPPFWRGFALDCPGDVYTYQGSLRSSVSRGCPGATDVLLTGGDTEDAFTSWALVEGVEPAGLLDGDLEELGNAAWRSDLVTSSWEGDGAATAQLSLVFRYAWDVFRYPWDGDHRHGWPAPEVPNEPSLRWRIDASPTSGSVVAVTLGPPTGVDLRVTTSPPSGIRLASAGDRLGWQGDPGGADYAWVEVHYGVPRAAEAWHVLRLPPDTLRVRVPFLPLTPEIDFWRVGYVDDEEGTWATERVRDEGARRDAWQRCSAEASL